MAGSLIPVTELGFAEFTGGLISQTLDAVISAYADQERKLTEIRRIAALSPLQYALEFVNQTIIDNELIKRFPPPRGSRFVSSVDVNAPYIPVSEGKKEKPAVSRLTGYQMVANVDYKEVSGNLVITQIGHINIRQAVAIELTKADHAFVQALASKGLPKVLVDTGRISSKLVFKLYEPEISVSGSLRNIPGNITQSISARKFMVSPVHTKGPEYLSLKADIVGEVEITFKTINE